MHRGVQPDDVRLVGGYDNADRMTTASAFTSGGYGGGYDNADRMTTASAFTSGGYDGGLDNGDRMTTASAYPRDTQQSAYARDTQQSFASSTGDDRMTAQSGWGGRDTAASGTSQWPGSVPAPSLPAAGPRAMTRNTMADVGPAAAAPQAGTAHGDSWEEQQSRWAGGRAGAPPAPHIPYGGGARMEDDAGGVGGQRSQGVPGGGNQLPFAGYRATGVGEVGALKP